MPNFHIYNCKYLKSMHKKCFDNFHLSQSGLKITITIPLHIYLFTFFGAYLNKTQSAVVTLYIALLFIISIYPAFISITVNICKLIFSTHCINTHKKHLPFKPIQVENDYTTTNFSIHFLVRIWKRHNLQWLGYIALLFISSFVSYCYQQPQASTHRAPHLLSEQRAESVCERCRDNTETN